ncbi:hypothetical protein A2U01_0046351, partial [Trifolium medium]|nr:hypothetical protein [Trifolium medium]
VPIGYEDGYKGCYPRGYGDGYRVGDEEIHLRRIDFEKKKKKKVMRINLRVGDEGIRLRRIDFEKKKKFGA